MPLYFPNLVTSVAARTGDVVLAKADVGLANVDNTSDADKPVSTAQATSIGLKLSKTGGTLTGNVIVSASYTGALVQIINPGTGAALRMDMASSTSLLMRALVTGETTFRYSLDAAGKMLWGNGTNAYDTVLYRSAADTLKTDDSLIVAGSLTVGTKPTITGSRSDGSALANLLTALASMGLITDSTAT